MPDAGRLTLQNLPHTGPAVSPLYPAPPWALPGTKLLKILYETDTEPVLDWLPPRLTRSSPPYAIVIVTHHPDSPIGPFSLAAQFIGCRATMFVRAFTLQAVTDTPAAMAALREVWGFPCLLGNVKLAASEDEASAKVTTGGKTVAELQLTEASQIEPDTIRLDPMLNVRITPSIEEGKLYDLLQTVQVDPEYTVKQALRGSGRLELGAAPGADWGLLPVRSVVSAVYCEVDTELPLARFVMPYS